MKKVRVPTLWSDVEHEFFGIAKKRIGRSLGAALEEGAVALEFDRGLILAIQPDVQRARLWY